MFTFFSRVFGTIITGVCLSMFGMIVLNLLMMLRGVPRALTGMQGLLRRFLRLSFLAYAVVFSWVRPWFLYQMGIDLIQPAPRTIAAVVLSLGVGLGILVLFGLTPVGWMVIVLLLHGLFVGLAWEHIITPDDFQLGSRIE